MELSYFSGKVPNFGDELNKVMWKRLISPGFFDNDSSNLFLGIGSIIWDVYEKTVNKLVVGSGYGGYKAVPDVHDGSWQFSFVRGPRTAKLLNIDPKLAITDAAILSRYIGLEAHTKKFSVSFMPHWESIPRGNWKEVCLAAGINYLDPRDDVTKLLTEIGQSDLVLSEAMHGVILSDTMRVPWIALEPINKVHRNKWFDWSESMAMQLDFVKLPVSGVLDYWSAKTGSYAASKKAHLAAKGLAFTTPFFVDRAAQGLLDIATQQVQLSSDSIFYSKSEQALDALSAIKGIELSV